MKVWFTDCGRRGSKIIAQGNAPLNDDGTFCRDKVKARQDADYPVVTPSRWN